MGRLHASLTSKLSIKGSPRKTFYEMGRRTAKFEKPCSRARVYLVLLKIPNAANPLVPFSRQVWSISPLVRAVGDSGACTPRVLSFGMS